MGTFSVPSQKPLVSIRNPSRPVIVVAFSAQETVNQNTVPGAVVGTVIGAGLGAIIGAISGNPGMGAAVGVGSRLPGGTISGAAAGHGYAWEAQRPCDIADQQRIYARGNQVAGSVQKGFSRFIRQGLMAHPASDWGCGFCKSGWEQLKEGLEFGIVKNEDLTPSCSRALLCSAREPDADGDGADT